MLTTIDKLELEGKVKDMYRRVAQEPEGKFHFDMGRPLAERLGYPTEDLDRIPADAIRSFAGVGYYFHLADLQPGEKVLDLGSGSGMDTFVAALKVGPQGRITGIDMTDEQLDKARQYRDEAGFQNVEYVKGYLDNLPFEDNSFDVVISNGVLNLCADKEVVFEEIARVLKPGGRLALADIVSEQQLPENIVCNTTLWAACIGGAIPEATYQTQLAATGLHVEQAYDNPQYQFISRGAQGAGEDYGVKSISLKAVKGSK